MGREVRMVPANWEHPKNKKGQYIPLLGGSYKKRLSEWKEGKQKWQEGFRANWYPKDNEPKWVPLSDEEKKMSYEEWDGNKPQKKDYIPEWSDSNKTHFQMCENTTEGTPISPVMETPEELAKWLTDNNASACGGMTATYEQWLNTIKAGYAPSMIIHNGVINSGVAYS